MAHQLQPYPVMRMAPRSVIVSPGTGGTTYSIIADASSVARPSGQLRSEANPMSQSVSQFTSVPPRVRPGDIVGICVPGSPVPEDRLRAGIDRLGGRYRLRMGEDIVRATGYLAGSDERRADELNHLLRDP